jgi:hypothetical protein
MAKKLSGKTSLAREPKAKRAKYPRHSVENSLRIPKAILDQNAGSLAHQKRLHLFLE